MTHTAGGTGRLARLASRGAARRVYPRHVLDALQLRFNLLTMLRLQPVFILDKPEGQLSEPGIVKEMNGGERKKNRYNLVTNPN